MLTASEYQLLQHFSQYVTDHKKQGIEEVLSQRTRYITVVLEDIFQSQNASAAIRTCECMGLQEVHVVETESRYHINPRVLKGADKWLDLKRYREKNINNIDVCFKQLRRQNYRILVADPDRDGVAIEDVDVTEGPLAIVFGNELNGISGFAREQADGRVRIPMYGFTESLNISVSVAISLNTLLSAVRRSGVTFQLSDDEKEAIRLAWYRKLVRRAEIVEREFFIRESEKNIRQE